MLSSPSFFLPYLFILIFSLLSTSSLCSPLIHDGSDTLIGKRTDPYFPDDPPSCPICAQDYPSINSCADAGPILQNFTMVIFNPSSFLTTIRCACTDTFQQTYPQCADCFIRTNQESLLSLNANQLPSVLEGMRQVCGLASTLLGNVSLQNGEPPLGSETIEPAPVATNNGIGIMGGESVSEKMGMGLVLSLVLGLVGLGLQGI